MNAAVLLHTMFMNNALEKAAVPMQDKFITEQFAIELFMIDVLLLHTMFVNDALEKRLYPCKTGSLWNSFSVKQ